MMQNVELVEYSFPRAPELRPIQQANQCHFYDLQWEGHALYLKEHHELCKFNPPIAHIDAYSSMQKEVHTCQRSIV